MREVTENRTITSVEARDHIIRTAINKKRPVFLWGPPGIGKSELVESIGEQLGNTLVIDLRMALLDPTDVRGVGFYNPSINALDWAPPVDLPSAETAAEYEHIILFLDEMNSAPPAVQAAAYQLVLNRRVGQYTLPENVAIIAAGNRETDKGVTYRMPSPLANRFVHFEMRVDFESWLDWAVQNGIESSVVGYLSQYKVDLFDFDPTSSSRSFATPRSWTFVSEQLEGENLSEKQITDIVAGTVGEGIAHKFLGHMKWADKLPKAMDVLTGSETKLKVDEISAQYTLMVNLCYELKELYDTEGKEDNNKWHTYVDNMLRFIMDNLGTELVIMGMRTAVMTYRLPIVATKCTNWNEFHNRYGKYITAAAS
jgi:hypothetical protein